MMFFRQVWALCFFLLKISNLRGYKVLLIGDSVDRCMVQDWCSFLRSRKLEPTEYNWGDDSIKYASVKGMMPSDICVWREDSIAFVHVFGSNATGPYFHLFANSPDDPFVDTKVRIKKAIELYQAHVGFPDRVLLQTNQWDVQRCYDFYWVPDRHSSLWNTTLRDFEHEVSARLDEIVALVGSKVDVGLRTAPWGGRGGPLLHEFNNVQRRLAKARNLTIFDFDQDVWSTVNYDLGKEKHVLRDWIHPNSFFTAAASEKVLGRQFTSSLVLGTAGSVRQAFTGGGAIEDYLGVNATKTVFLVRIRTEQKIFFVNRAARSLHRNPTHGLLGALRIGPPDIMDVEGDALHHLGFAAGIAVPDIFDECTMLNLTSGVSVVWDNRLRLIPTASLRGVAALCNVTIANNKGTSGAIHPLILVEPPVQFFVNILPLGPQMPDIFHDGTLLKMRGQREIFYVTGGGGLRYSIPNMQALWALGKDLSEVQELTDIEELESIPLGPTSNSPFKLV